MKQDVACANCITHGRLPNGQVVQMNKPMTFIAQYPVRGAQTYAYHCTGSGSCNGKVFLQARIDPRTRRKVLVPVRLTGADAELQPVHLAPKEAMQIPVAYTVGGGTGTMRHHVKANPIGLPAAGIQLDPRIGQGTMITESHPMHPNNLRRRIQPVGLHEFGR